MDFESNGPKIAVIDANASEANRDEEVPLIPERTDTNENLIPNPPESEHVEEINRDTPLSNNIGLNNVVPIQQEQNLFVGGCIVVRDYLLEFLRYLRVRTGFRPNHFRAPDELQRAMERMSISNLPMTVWRSFMDASMSIIAMSSRTFNRSTIIKVFVEVVGVVANFFMDFWLFRATMWALKYIPVGALISVCIFIYHFIRFSAGKLIEYLQKKLGSLIEFTVEKLESRSRLKLNRE